MNALDATTCYVLPNERPDTLLIYLHGIVPPDANSVQKTNLERVVIRASRRANVAALLPRGEQGLAPARQQDWWGWPTGEAAYRRRAPTLIRELQAARTRFEQWTGISFAHVYVAGSSAGAYFVSLLALHGGLDVDGFAVISGGSGIVTPELAALRPTPFYVGYSTSDTVGPSARALATLLQRASWPVRLATHAVPHGAHEVYLDEAFSFWRHQSEKQTLPLEIRFLIVC